MDSRLYLNYIINPHNTNFKKIHNEHKHSSTKIISQILDNTKGDI